jgi:hypothetical protein
LFYEEWYEESIDVSYYEEEFLSEEEEMSEQEEEEEEEAMSFSDELTVGS